MKKIKYLCLLFVLISSGFIYADYIDENKAFWAESHKHLKPEVTVTKWFVPFKTKNRNDKNTIKIISVFEAHRNSYLKGHIHTGLDIIPDKKYGKYTDVYPIERALRDTRLSMIWTGTSEIMNLLIQHEYYNQVLDPSYDRRKMEKDAMNPDEAERCFSDEDMWEVHENEQE